MSRFVAALSSVALVLVLTISSVAGAQSDAPLLNNQFHCAEAQAAFAGGPQPTSFAQTATVEVATSCYFVISVAVPAGESVQLTYSSGSYDALNIAFYDPTAAPGASFHDPANVGLGGTSSPGRVPGDGVVEVWVVIQGVGGPATGTAAVEIDTVEFAASPTTTAAPETTEAPTTTVAEVITTEAPVDEVVETTDAGEETTTTDDGEDDSTEAVAAPATDEADSSGGGLPWWLLGVVILGALGWLGWLALRARKPAAVAPWDRSVMTWTLQHSAPTGSCSSRARALVDPDDDGSLNGYNISNLFALPRTGKKVRLTVDPPMLNQLDAVWAAQGSGEELRSAVEAYVNGLCRHLHKKKAPADSTLLTEMTKPDVVVHGEVHACVDGGWQMFEGWRDVPDSPDGQIQHDIVQVAVLGVGNDESESWLDRADELTSAITTLIETRRAPAGLWVFD